MLIIFSLSLFVSAGLLFLVQPMFAKMVLPKLGGTPAVWITGMVFYQAALLAGYVYAHLTARRLGVRRQAVAHLALLGSALLVLPLGVSQGWLPPPGAHPAPYLLMILLVSVGLPFFVISITAPMLQMWFAQTGHAAARDPYFLYAASNLGSMAALLGYPLLVEPHLSLARQAWVWGLGYGLLALLIIVCGVILWRMPRPGGASAETANPAAPAPAAASAPPSPAGNPGALTIPQRVWWVLWSFAPSSLLLGVTTYLTTDIAAAPLLWVIPLALYLLTFVLVFARRQWVSRRLMLAAQPVLLLLLGVLSLWGLQAEGLWVLPIHLAAFFVTAMVCHGELARHRPSTDHLTEYYLWIAVGGVLGGLFNAVIAPLIFKTLAEYPLVLVLACLLRPGPEGGPPRLAQRLLDVALPLALGLLLVGGIRLGQINPSATGVSGAVVVLTSLAVMLGYSFAPRPLRFGLGVGAFFLAGMIYSAGNYPVLHGERSFFGVMEVKTDGDGYYHMFYHGTTLHGAQCTDPERRREPLTYYISTGPVGQMFEQFWAADSPRNVAIVGLGAGSLACYAISGENWDFYEIDPAVVRIAKNPKYFTYLKDCQGKVNIILGDARLSLAQASEHHYGIIFLDAFTSDAVPIHLINREALQLYLSKLGDGGLIVFHISNRYLDLKPVLANLARDAGLACMVQHHEVTEEEQNAYYIRTSWVVMARKEADLAKLAENDKWQTLPGREGARLWTDDFSDILSALLWPSLDLKEKLKQALSALPFVAPPPQAPPPAK